MSGISLLYLQYVLLASTRDYEYIEEALKKFLLRGEEGYYELAKKIVATYDLTTKKRKCN